MLKWVFFLLLFLPGIIYCLPKELPEGYMYVGIKPAREQWVSLLQKFVTPELLPEILQEFSRSSKKEMGIDLTRDDLEKYGLALDSYLEMEIYPKNSRFYLFLPAKNPPLLSKQLKAILKTKWANVTEKSFGKITEYSTTNPKFKGEKVFFEIHDDNRILFASSRKELEEYASLKKIPLNSSIFKETTDYIDLKKPLLVMYTGSQFYKDFLEADLNALPFFMFLGSEKEKITLNFLLEGRLSKELTGKYPHFIEDNPLAFMQITGIDPKEVRRLLKENFPGSQTELLNSLSFENSLGENAFIAVHDFNYSEIIQNLYNNFNFIAGIELKDPKPYEAFLESLLKTITLGQKQGKNMMSAINYQSSKIYSVRNMNTQYGSFDAYFLLFPDYLIFSTNLEVIKKTIDNKAVKKKLNFPVKSEMLYLFLDFEKIFRKLPVTPFIKQQGFAADNLKYMILDNLVVDKERETIKAILSVMFKN